MKTKIRRVFSESYKREQVALIEKGEITVSQLGRMLGMKSPNPIYLWVKKYGKKPITETVVVESQSDFLRLKQLEKQLKEAEQLIGRQQIQIQFYEEIIDEVETHYGENPLKKFLKK
jgi:transposase-like protein